MASQVKATWDSAAHTALFHHACADVIAHASNAYAKAYAHAGLRMWSREEIGIQCLYIRTNLGGWRGEQARRVKDNLDAIHRASK